MNSKLVNYGIFEEESTFRIHVCPKSESLYLISTKELKELIKQKNYKIVSVKTGNIETAKGYLVPVRDINLLENTLEIPLNPTWKEIKEQDDTIDKGSIAQIIAEWSIAHFFQINTELIIDANKNEQLKGIDFKINKDKFQVKCDYNGGEKGTGNLFIQIQECNPYNFIT